MRGTHRERGGLSTFFHRGGDCGRGIGCSGGHTLAAGYTVVGIDGSQRYRVTVLSRGGVGERTRERQFLKGGRATSSVLMFRNGDRTWEEGGEKDDSGPKPRNWGSALMPLTLNEAMVKDFLARFFRKPLRVTRHAQFRVEAGGSIRRIGGFGRLVGGIPSESRVGKC